MSMGPGSYEQMLGDGAARRKKKRMTEEQVRALESTFGSRRKLEMEQKQELAQRLGLQPRQVAVWFQNRRARSKIKHLEQHFSILKSQYDAVRTETTMLRAQVARLTAELEAAASAVDNSAGDAEAAIAARPAEPSTCEEASAFTAAALQQQEPWGAAAIASSQKSQIRVSSPTFCCSASSHTEEQRFYTEVDGDTGLLFNKSNAHANDNSTRAPTPAMRGGGGPHGNVEVEPPLPFIASSLPIKSQPQNNSLSYTYTIITITTNALYIVTSRLDKQPT